MREKIKEILIGDCFIFSYNFLLLCHSCGKIHYKMFKSFNSNFSNRQPETVELKLSECERERCKETVSDSQERKKKSKV